MRMPTQGRFSTYRVVMRPSRSVLASLSQIPGVTVYVKGISLAGNASTTLTYIELPEELKAYEELMGILKTSPSVIDYQIVDKRRYSVSLAITKNMCDFYKYTLSSHRFTFFPYTLRGGKREFYLVSAEKTKEIVSNLLRHGEILFFEKVPLATAMKSSSMLGLKIVLDEHLTHSQRMILKEAYRLGYYDWPRKISLGELAEKFGISKATLSEHLRRGEQKLFTLFLESL